MLENKMYIAMVWPFLFAATFHTPWLRTLIQNSLGTYDDNCFKTNILSLPTVYLLLKGIESWNLAHADIEYGFVYTLPGRSL
jgi:hypothetical protein